MFWSKRPDDSARLKACRIAILEEINTRLEEFEVDLLSEVTAESPQSAYTEMAAALGIVAGLNIALELMTRP